MYWHSTDRRAYGIAAVLVGILIAATMMTTVLPTRRARDLPGSQQDRYSVREYFRALALFWLVSYRLTEKQLADMRRALPSTPRNSPS